MSHSSGLSPVLIYLLMLFGVGVALYLQYLVKQRRREWQALAAELHCTLTEESTGLPFTLSIESMLGNLVQSHLASQYGFPLFDHGSRRCAPFTIKGTFEGMHIACFDYQYSISHGRSSTTYYFLCLIVPTHVPFARLCLHPESMGDKVMGFLGVRDIQFESDDFNRRFMVTCDNERFAFDILHPRAMELLMASPEICIEGVGGHVMFYHPRAYERASGLRAHVLGLLRLGRDFMKLVPEYLAEDRNHS